MDERKLKRLAIITLTAIVLIMIAKYLLTEAVTTLGNAAQEKKRAAAMQAASAPVAEPVANVVPTSAPASAVVMTGDVGSAVSDAAPASH